MLSPKRVKHRKVMRSVGQINKCEAVRNNKVSFGDYGLAAKEPKWITNRQIEAARIAMTRYIKRSGKVWIRVFPHKPYTKKPLEVRMGKGKGNPEWWVACVKRGTIMFEMTGVPVDVAREAMRLAGNKLPIDTAFVVRRSVE